jgi:methoxymalonate biosynthesis acyl carrier protein
MNEHIARQIREFITDRYPQTSISDDDDIFSLGFINSLFAMELVMFIERTFDISIPNTDLQIGHFRTVNAMKALVKSQVVVTSRA